METISSEHPTATAKQESCKAAARKTASAATTAPEAKQQKEQPRGGRPQLTQHACLACTAVQSPACSRCREHGWSQTRSLRRIGANCPSGRSICRRLEGVPGSEHSARHQDLGDTVGPPRFCLSLSEEDHCQTCCPS